MAHTVIPPPRGTTATLELTHKGNINDKTIPERDREVREIDVTLLASAITRRRPTFESCNRFSLALDIFLGGILHAGSRINFRTTFPDSHISKSEFKNEISSSALLDIQLTLFCVCGFISPRIRTFVEKRFHSLFSEKKGSKSGGCFFVSKLKLRSTSSAEKNFADRIT